MGRHLDMRTGKRLRSLWPEPLFCGMKAIPLFSILILFSILTEETVRFIIKQQKITEDKLN
ncbi:hypothetical protein HMPREF1985_01921 [Mitsuokella sp. oral taxon 131 str. W9106]|nr:hypothetical protein HMPREF1985_01921 [Mitsuokella sp. oral taxon 131 str. W9106]